MVEPNWRHAPKRGLSAGAIVGIVGGGIALVLVAVAAIVVLVVFTSDTERFKVPGVGMEPTIQAGQTVSATKIDPGKYSPKRGDIVVFNPPTGWSAAPGDRGLIKRVVGLPGERLACCDPQGRWTIDGKPLDEPYIKPGSASAGDPFDISVPDGRLWVMGDNRSNSFDSRMQFASTSDISASTIPVANVTAVVKF